MSTATATPAAERLAALIAEVDRWVWHTGQQEATAADLTARFRAARSAQRGLDGRTAATTNAHARHAYTMRMVQARLVQLGHRELVGLLVDEAKLLARVLDAKRAGHPRQELRTRLNITQRRIRDVVAADVRELRQT